ncbi:MAG: magnesium transporter CorA family protein [Deltaproteobacteria bacterium]|nr:magnesium transporter CorA family protein [Deltaproteobacteria bacterium]
MIVLCHFEEGTIREVSRDEIAPLLQNEKNTVWVDAEVSDPQLKDLLTGVFHFHPLSIEDALSEFHHPKTEVFENYLFFTLPLIAPSVNGQRCFRIIHLAFFWGRNFVVSVKSSAIDFFPKLQETVGSASETMAMGPDFLMERILHGVFEETAPCIEDIHQQIDRLEERVFKGGSDEDFSTLFQLRKDVLDLRHVLNAEEGVIRHLSSGELSQICPECLPYLHDVHDHIYRLSSEAESCQLWITALFSAHQTQLSEKTNAIMKHLTLVATTVLPLTVVTSFFGMNFLTLPGLRHPAGWLFVSGGMLLAVIVLFLFFKKRRWF